MYNQNSEKRVIPTSSKWFLFFILGGGVGRET